MLPNPDSLPLANQVAQMVVVRASGFLFDHQIRYPQWEPPMATLCHWIKDWGVGGVIVLGGSAAELTLRIQQLQSWASVPLLVAADVEEGIGQRFAGATWFPPPMALGAIAQHNLPLALRYATQMGYYTAQEAQAIGLNWLLAPVADVNNNPMNPVINVRSFGDEPDLVCQLVHAFIQGTVSFPVLTTAKHFPGHGDTDMDSHLQLPVLSHSRERLSSVEWPPFMAAIAAGVDAIMTAHLRLPQLDLHHPATFSRPIIHDELRHHFKFQGLVVTDALIMGAITDGYGVNEAPVLAVAAGADIILMPGDPVGAIRSICNGVESGQISAESIRAAVARIWQVKDKVNRPPLVSSPSTPCLLLDHIAQPSAAEAVKGILQSSMMCHCPQPLLPMPDNQGRNLIILDHVLDCKFLGRHTPAITMPAKWGYVPQIIDNSTPGSAAQAPHQGTLLQLFIRGNPFRGSAHITQVAEDWFHYLLRTGQLKGLIIYGSPYGLPQFVSLLPPSVPYVFSYGQMEVAQALALQELNH